MTAEEAKKGLEENLLIFGKIVTPRMFAVKTPDFHKEIASLYHSDKKRVNIIAPRGHGKSSLTKLMVLHHLMYAPTPIKVVVLISKTQGHSKRLLSDIMDIIQYSAGFRELYGYWGPETAKKWTNEEVILKDGSVIVTRGSAQQIVGLNQFSQRPTFVVYDDPEDENNTKTRESMDFTLNVLLKAVIPGVDPMHGRIFLIGTVQKEGCLVLKVSGMSNWVTKRYSATIDEKEKRVLWPEWFSWNKLQEEKRAYEEVNKLSVYFSEYESILIGDENALFNEKDFRYWDGDIKRDLADRTFIRIKEIGYKRKEELGYSIQWNPITNPKWVEVYLYIGVDPASSVKKDADYSAMALIAVDYKGYIYTLDIYQKRVRPMELANMIVSWYKVHKPIRVNIESVGYQEMLRDYLRNLDGIYIPGLEVPYKPRDSKSNRLETLQPYLRGHKLFFKKGMSFLEDTENQFLLYPRVKHDDILDAIYYSKQNAVSPSEDTTPTNTKEVLNKDEVTSWAMA